MPETPIHEQHYEDATDAFSDFSGSLPGDYRSDLTAISTRLARARDAANNQAKRLRQMYKDPSFERPVNHLEVSRAAQDEAEATAGTNLREADEAITALAARLRSDALPPTPSNSTDRLAARQEIEVVLGDKRAMEALTAFEALTASTNPHVLAELSSEYGRNLMEATGVAPEGVDRVLDLVIEATAAGRTGDRKRMAAARALAKLQRLQVAYTATSAGVNGTLRRLRQEHRL